MSQNRKLKEKQEEGRKTLKREEKMTVKKNYKKRKAKERKVKRVVNKNNKKKN